MNIIEVKNLNKKYGNIEAVKDLTFTVRENSLFAFLGQNGAGKSTTINIISTLLNFDSGSVKVADNILGSDDDRIRATIGVVFQNSMLDDLLTVRENLHVRGSFYGLSSKEVDSRVDELNALLEIKSYYGQKYGELSGGQKRKADIARALINWPKILFLDEPTTGLDPKSRRDIWELINQLRIKRNITIFLTTHYMQEVHDANKVVIIDKGRILAVGSSEELRKKYSNDRLKLLYSKELISELEKDNTEFYLMNDTINIILKDSFQGISYVNKYRSYINEFEIIKGNMDDVFLNVTGKNIGKEL
ncbi:ABC transporter ATP-binding protein [Thiospirochaeta perfilievii]|uniref:ABC transporter ATP-binding protein n=1 Tax=Thiospirochaeta perfilievii TaxID=252967 RepID=A0A5C1Q839_9SPIO|nr:ABC transporter ATP-binding protein [Thiospirochaeta perfilievii]QEN03179.1 ABC transporter ATP-binding protein [Thiospirochaeta perfilievii]